MARNEAHHLAGSRPRPDRRLAHLIPDEPLWIDLRGPLLSGHCLIYSGPDAARGFVLRSTDYPFAFVWGEPPESALVRAVASAEGDPDFRLLAPPSAAEHLLPELPGWRLAEEAILHRWRGEARGGGAPAPLPPEASLELVEAGEDAEELVERVPEDLRPEVHLALRRSCPLAVAWVEQTPVSFCYAAWSTETLWDVAVGTEASHRRRGLAAATFEAVRRHLEPRGLAPVWGAYNDNRASRRLAAKLGFVEDARLATLAPPG